MKAHQEDIKINIKVVWGWQENKIHPSKRSATYTRCQREPWGSQHRLALCHASSSTFQMWTHVIFKRCFRKRLLIWINAFTTLISFYATFLFQSTASLELIFGAVRTAVSSGKQTHRSPQRHPRQSDGIKQEMLSLPALVTLPLLRLER